jgi:hypothetical protein
LQDASSQYSTNFQFQELIKDLKESYQALNNPNQSSDQNTIIQRYTENQSEFALRKPLVELTQEEIYLDKVIRKHHPEITGFPTRKERNVSTI